MRVRSAGNRYPSITQAVVRTSTASFEIYGWDVPGDPINAAMATTAGQFMNSTQAAAEGGPAVRVSGGWYSLAAGASGANQQIT